MQPIRVYPDMKWRDLQQVFNDLFPYLRLEVESGNKLFIDRPLAAISRLTVPNSFDIVPDMTVDELEMAFQYKMGLPCRVLRRSGYTWLETAYTRRWSLERQNDKGAELSRDLR
nr:hypothetical protein [uncultured Arsenicibacter sp.]